jgi:8-oxo-dGTP diphosphatase
MSEEIIVVAALIKEEDKFLLCQRKEGDRYGLLWEFPGGCVKKGEELNRAIEREIKEELNVEIRTEVILKEFYDNDEEIRIKVYLFSCSIRKGMLKAKDCRDFGFFSLKEIEKLNLAPVDKKVFSYLKYVTYDPVL